jgi:hypothetical protein
MYGDAMSNCFCRLMLERSTFPAPDPVPNATDDGFEAPLLKLKISIQPSAPFLVDSPVIPSNLRKISTPIDLLPP